MRKTIHIIIATALISLGCASVHVEGDSHSARLAGRSKVTVICVEDLEAKTRTCTSEVSSDGLTENVTTLVIGFFEMIASFPGKIVRGAAGVLP